MKILPINLSFKYTQAICNNNKFNYKQESDGFIRTTQMTTFGKSEDDKSFSAFKKWSVETNFPNTALSIMADSSNIIGKGEEGTVYQIPNNDNWVIKKYKRSNLIQYHVDKPEIIEINDKSPSLNIGQKVASVRIPINTRLTEHFYILKKQTGKPLGLPKIFINNVSAASSRIHLNSLENLANFPLSSYEKLISDIQYVTDIGYEFDGENPQNYLLDNETQTINFVDIDEVNEENKSQFAEVLYALIGSDFNDKFIKSHRPVEEKELAKKSSLMICAKFITAMDKNKVKFSDTYHFNKLLHSQPMTIMLGTEDLQEKRKALKNIKLF